MFRARWSGRNASTFPGSSAPLSLNRLMMMVMMMIMIDIIMKCKCVCVCVTKNRHCVKMMSEMCSKVLQKLFDK